MLVPISIERFNSRNQTRWLMSHADAIDGRVMEKSAIPPLWDGKSAEWIVEQLESLLLAPR
jgi:hypothetical protein